MKCGALLVLLAACDPVVTPVGELSPDASGVLASGYLEAESGLLSGFTVGDDPAASNGQFIAPPDVDADAAPGAARAGYVLHIARAGDYLIWGRLRAPGALNNRFWFQLDAGDWIKWRISTGEIWYWDDFHDDFDYGTALHFSLGAGDHRLTIANCVPGVALDRLYFTAMGDTPPGNDTPCHPPDSIEVAGACQPSCGSQSGTTCGDAACAGLTPIPSYDCAVCCHVEP